MGDRRNVRIEEESGGQIFLYTHWDGSDLPDIVASALDRGRGRWGDEAYLTRIIFSEMIKGDVEGETGYGISTYQCDENHPDVVINMANQTADRVPFDKFVEYHKSKV